MAVQVSGTLIQIPQGDTGVVKFVYGDAQMLETERALFTVAGRNGSALLRKVLSPDEHACAFYLPFVYADTMTLKPDVYDWSLRIVRGGMLDENGRIVDLQSSRTVILQGKLIIMPVAGGAR